MNREKFLKLISTFDNVDLSNNLNTHEKPNIFKLISRNGLYIIYKIDEKGKLQVISQTNNEQHAYKILLFCVGKINNLSSSLEEKIKDWFIKQKEDLKSHLIPGIDEKRMYRFSYQKYGNSTGKTECLKFAYFTIPDCINEIEAFEIISYIFEIEKNKSGEDIVESIKATNNTLSKLGFKFIPYKLDKHHVVDLYIVDEEAKKSFKDNDFSYNKYFQWKHENVSKDRANRIIKKIEKANNKKR